MVFYAVTGQQRKVEVGDSDISQKWAVRARKHLCPQDFCSVSLLIQFFCCWFLDLPVAVLHGPAQGLLTLCGQHFTSITPS